jgi:hypothetical protein
VNTHARAERAGWAPPSRSADVPEGITSGGEDEAKDGGEGEREGGEVGEKGMARGERVKGGEQGGVGWEEGEGWGGWVSVVVGESGKCGEVGVRVEREEVEHGEKLS